MYCSKSLPRLFGAVVVATQPKVHTVDVRGSIKPDPLLIQENDVVAWSFNEQKNYDVTQIHTVKQVLSPQSRMVPPR